MSVARSPDRTASTASSTADGCSARYFSPSARRSSRVSTQSPSPSPSKVITLTRSGSRSRWLRSLATWASSSANAIREPLSARM